ncbi:MAG: AAA family ATPase [Deltaproteobacteria bacterium]|nr:MAG: AAA family ATPase [Deltaproteobacteria bacterium]
MNEEQKSAEELLNEFEKLLGDGPRTLSSNSYISDHWLSWKTLNFVKTLLFNTKDKCVYAILELTLSQLDKTGFDFLFNEVVSIITDYFEELRKVSKVFHVPRNEIDRILDEIEEDKRAISPYLKYISRIWESHKEAGLLCTKALMKAIHLQQRELDLEKESEFRDRLTAIGETFDLNELEKDIIVFLYLLEEDSGFDENLANSLAMNNFSKSTPFYEFLLNSDRVTIRNILNKNSKLSNIGMIECSPRRSTGTIELSGHVTEYLTGLDDRHITDIYFKKPCVKRQTLALERHNIDPKEMEIIKLLLQSPGGKNILLHGEPGTGKTEFVHSLAEGLGMNLHLITSHNPDSRYPGSHRKSALAAARNLLNRPMDLILIDECDDILNLEDEIFNSRGEKAWINTFLEESEVKIIWVSNKSSSIMSSTKRRFNYSLEFQPLDSVKRLNIWENQINETQINLFTKNELEEYAGRFEVNAGGIALALKDLQRIMELETNTEKLKLALEQILVRHQSFAIGYRERLSEINKNYDSSLLNTDQSTRLLETKLQRWLDSSEIRKVITNFNILFQGPSGTGKTEYAKYLAKKLGKKLLVKRTSDILDKYLGGTEQNLASIFYEAEETDSILFLDEADSLFLDRKSADRHHQIQQTNEILMQMENFKGILICSTNAIDSMDSAVIRRFSIKMGFDYLSSEGKEKLTLLLFDEYQFSKEDLLKVSSIQNLTPGDFKNVFHRSLLEEELNKDDIIEALEKEASFKRENKLKIGL